MATGDSFPKFYLYDEQVAARLASHTYLIEEPAGVTHVDDALIEPLRRIKDSAVKEYEGGVCTSDFTFIAGQHRAWDEPHTIRSCESCYECPDDEIEYVDEEVIFGGILCNHFGHMIMDTASRLWYVVSHPECTAKVAFVTLPSSPTFFQKNDMHYRFLEMCGIDFDRIILIWKPTRFKRVIVPDETVFLEGKSAFKAEARITYDRIRQNAPHSPYKKIYLTRSKYTDLNPVVGEREFEDYFRSRGYEIISPELLSFDEQVALFANATHIAGSTGSVTLLLCCANPGVECVFLNRSTDPVPGHVMISHLRQAKSSYVDTHVDILPEDHIHGVFLMSDTECWKSFLADNPDFAKSGDAFDNDFPKLLLEYIKLWGQNINTNLMYQYVNDEGLPEIAYRINRYLLGSDANPNSYGPMAQTIELNDELREEQRQTRLALASPQSMCIASLTSSGSTTCRLDGSLYLPLVTDVSSVTAYATTNPNESGEESLGFATRYSYDATTQMLTWSAELNLEDCLRWFDPATRNQAHLYLKLTSGQASLSLGLATHDELPVLYSDKLISNDSYLGFGTDEQTDQLMLCLMPLELALESLIANKLEDAWRQGDTLHLKGSLSLRDVDQFTEPRFRLVSGRKKTLLVTDVDVDRNQNQLLYEVTVNLRKLVKRKGNEKSIACHAFFDLLWDGHAIRIPLSLNNRALLEKLKSLSYDAKTHLVTFHEKNDRLYLRLTAFSYQLERPAKTTIRTLCWNEEGLALSGFIQSVLLCANDFSLELELVNPADDSKSRHAIPLQIKWDKGYYAEFSHVIGYPDLIQGMKDAMQSEWTPRLVVHCSRGEQSIPIDKNLFSLSIWQRIVSRLEEDAPAHKGVQLVVGLDDEEHLVFGLESRWKSLFRGKARPTLGSAR